MCGICGIVYHDPARPAPEELVHRMNDSIRHRGPDDSGVYTDRNAGLGFRRLAIIDLSSAGHQPMFSADGRCCITYNGEIYNYVELRQELEKSGVQFQST